MNHHYSVMTSLLRIKILKIDKFGDFSCDIDYKSRTGVFRDAISLLINQCDPRRPKGASGGHKVFASRAALASEARLYIYTYIYIYIYIYSRLRLIGPLFNWVSRLIGPLLAGPE